MRSKLLSCMISEKFWKIYEAYDDTMRYYYIFLDAA